VKKKMEKSQAGALAVLLECVASLANTASTKTEILKEINPGNSSNDYAK